MKKQPYPNEPLPLNRAVRRLRVPGRWLRQEIEAGRLPALRAGRAILIHVPTVADLLVERAKTEQGAKHTQVYDPGQCRSPAGDQRLRRILSAVVVVCLSATIVVAEVGGLLVGDGEHFLKVYSAVSPALYGTLGVWLGQGIRMRR